MSSDTRRFAIAFALMLAGFAAEFAWVHLRLAPEAGAAVRHADLDLVLDPGGGRARVSARVEIEASPGGASREVALVLPAAAGRVRVADADGRPLVARLRSHRHIYLAGRPQPGGGRAWRLQRYAEPRLDVRPRGPAPALTLRVEYELDGALLRGAASLGRGRTLLPGGWSPRAESASGRAAPEFTYRLRVEAPAPDRVVASGALVSRRAEGGREASEWKSVWPVADVWVLAAPLEEFAAASDGRRVRVYVQPGRDPGLAPQIASAALQATAAIETRAGALPEAEWQIATVERLGAIGRGRPPLVLLDAGVFRRAARRPGSLAERQGWIAREMAAAWLRAPVPGLEAQSAALLREALGAVLAQIALSHTPRRAGAAGAPVSAGSAGSAIVRAGGKRGAGGAGWRQRVDWMMRCRAYAGEGALRPPLTSDGRLAAGLLGTSKLPAALDTLASQVGDARFLDALTGAGEEDLIRRLRRAGGGGDLSQVLTHPWLPDLSVEAAEIAPGGVRATIADRGMGPQPLRVAVRLVAPDGTERTQWTRVHPGSAAEVRFAGARAWGRIEVDPDRRVFQIEFSNDALPRGANPWAALQRLWDVRRWIGRGEYERAVEEGKAAAALDPDSGELGYWIGFALLKVQRGAEAIEWLERARASSQDSDVVAAETLYLLGQAYAAAGQGARARELYRQVIEEGWTSFSVERAQRALETLPGS